MITGKISDVCSSVCSGGTPSKKHDEYFFGGTIPWLNTAEIRFNRIYSTEKYITEAGLSNSSAKWVPANTVIVAMYGATAARVAISKIPLTTNQACCNLIVDENKADYRYVYYWLYSKYTQLALLANGGAQQNLNAGQIKDFPIALPSLEEQKRISDILSAYDDMIEINNLINDNLLKQAQTVFKSWFIDFDPFDEPMVLSPAGYEVPQSLKMIQIQDLPHLLETGKRPKGGAVSEGIPSVGAENVKMLGVFDASSAKYIPYDFAASLKKGKIEGYELLLYKDGGKPGSFTPHFSMFGEGFPYTDFYINEHVFKLDFYDRGFNEFAYLYMHTDYPYHWLASNGGKAAIPGINQQDVNSIWIFHPSHHKVQEFCRWVQPLFTSILSNCAQNMRLTKIRDSLLPRLMFSDVDGF